MQQLYDIFFASSNRHKYTEVKKILGNFGIRVCFFQCNLEEIQSNSLNQIALKKVQNAFVQCKKPVIIEDDGIFIESLKGFPGPFSSFVFKTIGNNGILKLVSNNRKAVFQSVIGYHDKHNGSILFKASLEGKISKLSKGKGWGYDPIFIPNGKKKTFAELIEKNTISHRYKALKKFSNWFLRMQE